MRIRVHEAALRLSHCHTRIPFRFGIHTLTEAPLCVATIRGEASDGSPVAGTSSELLVPRWFEKDPSRSVADDIRSLIDSANSAGEIIADGSISSVFDHWWRAYEALALSAPPEAPDRLTRGFGCALWERAMMDAAARTAGISFPEALEVDLYRIDAARIRPELVGWKFFPVTPPPSLDVRHTIGLLDSLDEDDRSPDSPQDGLPVTLIEDIRRHGLRWFKVKVGGNPEEDLIRLRRIAEILTREAPGFRVTLDGNEQYGEPSSLADVLSALSADSGGALLVEALVCIEQPVPRAQTFDPASSPAPLAKFAPVIIDEADHGPEAFPAAFALGYRGVSTKNCKGVARAVANRGLCERLGDGAFQSAEDLTNLPPWGLQQDLLTVAVLGLTHVERNGHHYFRGLDHLPRAEVLGLLEHHGDLYRSFDGGAELVIESGQIAIGSLSCPGYGCAIEPAIDSRTPADAFVIPEV
jgi:hypothetical protein